MAVKLYSQAVESISAGAEADGSVLVGLGEAATKASTDFPCHDPVFLTNLTNAGFDTDIAAQEASSNTTIVAGIKDDNIGLTGRLQLEEAMILMGVTA